MSAVPVFDRAAWLAERRTYLGATDLAAVSGMSKYKSALEVWLEKTGRAKETDMGVYAMVGLALEPVIAEIVQMSCSEPLVRGTLIRHPEYPVIGCNPDYLLLGARRAKEIKTFGTTTRKEWGDGGTDEVPIAYWAQAQIQRYLLTLVQGEPWDCDVINFDRNMCAWDEFPIPRRDDVAEAMIEAGLKFKRDHIDTDVPPPAGGMDCDTHWLARAFPYGEGEEPVFATKAIDKAAEEVLRLKAEANPLYTQAKAAENLMKQFMGKATKLITMSGDWTFKNDKPSTDWEAVARYCFGTMIDKTGMFEETETGLMRSQDFATLVGVHTHQEVNWERVALARGASLDLIAEHTTVDSKGTKRVDWKEIAALLEEEEEEDGLPDVFMYPVTYWEGVARAFKPGDDVVALFTTPGSRRFLAPRKK